MRTIKFRGQTVDTKELIYGDLIQTEKDFKNVVEILDWSKVGCKPEKSLVVNPETVSEFTGLTDKNGVEIYEGDILLDVEFDENGNNISGKFPVVYDYSKCQFAIDNSFKKDGSNLVNFVEYFGIENLEVVGNICDNIEMLFSF